MVAAFAGFGSPAAASAVIPLSKPDGPSNERETEMNAHSTLIRIERAIDSVSILFLVLGMAVAAALFQLSL